MVPLPDVPLSDVPPLSQLPEVSDEVPEEEPDDVPPETLPEASDEPPEDAPSETLPDWACPELVEPSPETA